MKNFGIEIDEKQFVNFAGKKTVQVIHFVTKIFN